VTGPENGSSQEQENETQIDAASPSSSVNILNHISIQSLLGICIANKLKKKF